MDKILLIEDEVSVVSFVNKGLSELGYSVAVAFDGQSGLSMLKGSNYNLIILDVMLPDMNGFDVCRAIRLFDKYIPVLFLTALGTSENIVLGLGAGADDYLVKPFKMIELSARIQSLLRRSQISMPEPIPAPDENVLKIGSLELNDTAKSLSFRGQPVLLTSTEYRLIHYFMLNKNKVLSRVDILQSVWGVEFDLGTNVVDVYVNYLRKKIDKAADEKYIHTVVGMGYVLKEPPKGQPV